MKGRGNLGSVMYGPHYFNSALIHCPQVIIIWMSFSTAMCNVIVIVIVNVHSNELGKPFNFKNGKHGIKFNCNERIWDLDKLIKEV